MEADQVAGDFDFLGHKDEIVGLHTQLPDEEHTLVSIQASWVVLRDFPKQVLVLKGTKDAGLIDPRAPGIADRLV